MNELKKYEISIDISDEQLKKPLVNIVQIVMDKLSKSTIKTLTKLIEQRESVINWWKSVIEIFWQLIVDWNFNFKIVKNAWDWIQIISWFYF